MKKRRANGGAEAPSVGNEGFTLLEVLIAFAILAIMLVPILQVFGGGLGVTETARGYSQAALLARSKLAELSVDRMQEGQSSGDFPEERGYSWQATVTADDSDVTLPDNTVVGIPPRKSGTAERRRPGSSGTSGGSSGPSSSRTGSGSGSSSSSFGQSRSTFGSGSSRSTFGSGSSSSGFGSSSSSSSFGQSRSGFGSGSSRSGFGSSSGSASGTAGSGSTFGFNRPQSGTQTPDTGGAQDADADATTQLQPYRITVTVRWGDASSGNGAVTLTTLRLVQPEQPGARAE